MKIKSLIVDDDDAVNFLHSIVLKESGIDDECIFVAINGKRALELLNQQAQSDNSNYLIFLDLNMPEMDGWQFLDELKQIEDYSKTFIVIVTSSVNIADREKSKTYENVIGFVEKPLNVEDVKKIWRLLE